MAKPHITGLQRLPTASNLFEVTEALHGYAGKNADMLFTQRKILRDAMEIVLPRVPALQDSYSTLLPFLVNSHDHEKSIAAVRAFVDDVLARAAMPDAETPDPLGPDAAFHRTILDHPDDDAPRFVYADSNEEHGKCRAELILLENALRDPTLPLVERESKEHRRHEALEAHLRQVLEDFTLPPLGNRTELPRETLHAFDEAKFDDDKQILLLQTLLRLPEQYADCHRLLRQTRLIVRNADNQEGFQGADRWYPFPEYPGTAASATPSFLRSLHTSSRAQRLRLLQKALQGFTKFQIIPLRPIPDFLPPLRAIMNASVINKKSRESSLFCSDDAGGLHPLGSIAQEPLWLWGQNVQDGWFAPDVRSNPLDSADAASGQFLANFQTSNLGYRFQLVEDAPNTPRKSTPAVSLAGRENLRGGQSVRDYHALLHPDDRRKHRHSSYLGETGQILQGHLLFHLSLLTERLLLPDAHPERCAASWCTGSQSPDLFGFVGWDRFDRRLDVCRYAPSLGGDDTAPRSSVGV